MIFCSIVVTVPGPWKVLDNFVMEGKERKMNVTQKGYPLSPALFLVALRSSGRGQE